MNTRLVTDTQPQPTLDLTGIERIVFLDIDQTLFLSQLEREVYTGYSVDRWRAFLEALKSNGSLVGIITNKDRCPQTAAEFNMFGNIYNGLPHLDPDEIRKRYDTICQCLFNYDGKNEGLESLLTPELIYYMNHGIQGSKGSAMQHADTHYLKGVIPKAKIWLIDDNLSRNIMASVVNKGYQFYQVPPAVYQTEDSNKRTIDKARLEEACISFMLDALQKLGIPQNAITASLLERITHRYYPQRCTEEKTEAKPLPADANLSSAQQISQSPLLSSLSLFNNPTALLVKKQSAAADDLDTAPRLSVWQHHGFG